MKKPRPRLFAAAPLFLLTVIAANRLIGLVRSVILARLWGAGIEAAAFELASTVTASLYETTVGAIIAAMFVPAFAARRQTSEEEADRFASDLFLPIVGVTLLLYTPLLLFPKATLTLFTKNTAEAVLAAAVRPTRLLALSRILLSAASLPVGILQTDGRPLFPAAVYLGASLFTLLSLAFFKDVPSASQLSSVTLLADLSVLLVLLFSTAKTHRFTKAKSLSIKHPFALLARTVGVMLFSAFIPTASLLATLFAARLGEETLTANGYALKWVLLAASLLSSAFHAVYYPRLAVAEDRAVAQKLKKPFTLILLLAASVSGFLLLAGEPLFTRLYRSEAFGEKALAVTVSLLERYALSLPFLAASSLLSDAAYLRGRTKELAFIGISFLSFDLFLLSHTLDTKGAAALPAAFFLASLLRFVACLFAAFMPKKRAKATDKLRLFLVLSDKNVGGAGRQLLAYLSCCDRSTFDVTVLLPEGASLADEVDRFGVRLLFCGAARSFSFSSIWAYYRLIRAERPHILHANASLSARIAAFLAAVPIRICTRHCVYPLPPLFKHRLSRVALGLATSLLSTSVIAVAKEAADNLYGMGVSPKKVTVIENGVRAISPSNEAREKIRADFGIAPDTTVAVVCARLEADKDIATLIKAVGLAKEKGQLITALIVGCGSEEQALRTLAEKLSLSDRVHFAGFVKDVSPYLNAADLYVNCSIGTEATSLGILEAMSLSLPIVATDYGGNPHLVKDGENCILIGQKNPEALASALTVMTDRELRARFGKTSYEFYTARYSAERMARRNEALYKKLFLQKGYTLS